MKTFGKAMVAIAAAVLFGVTPVASAQEHWGHGGGGSGFKMLLRAANLSASQKTQVHAILKASQQENQSLRTQAQAFRAQIGDKLAGTAPVTVSDITAIQQQLAQVTAQLAQHRAETAVQIRAVLTPQQLQHVSQVHQQMESLRVQMKAVMHRSAEETELDPAGSYSVGAEYEAQELP